MLDQPTGLLATLTAVRPNITVIHNPTSGRRHGRRLQQFVEAATRCGLEVAVRTTGRPGDAEAMASQAACDGWTDALVVAGGDGTINEVINGLAGAASPPIALLPMGTANVLAAEVGAADSPVALVDDIIRAARSPRLYPRICVARANDRCFAMMAGVGFDAHVVAAVGQRVKRLAGKAAYVAAFARTMMRFEWRRYQVSVDGMAYEAASVVIANGHFYGGRFTCAPDAKIDQAELNVCLFLRGGPVSALRYGAALVSGRLHRRDDIRIVRGRRVQVTWMDGDPVHCDGDLMTCLPLEVEARGETIGIIAGCR
jgi:YegS/Rv2252/BmrU family lipid kinase